MIVKGNLMGWWCWWVLGGVHTGVARAATTCLPPLLLEGASQNPQRPWKFATWQRVLLRARPVPTVDCPNLPETLEYCWKLHFQQGGDAPQPVACDEVAQCQDEGPVLAREPHSMGRGNYTVQVVARPPGSRLPHRCLTGYFTIPFNPGFPLYLFGGPKVAVPLGMPLLYIIQGGADLDHWDMYKRIPGSITLKWFDAQIHTWFTYEDKYKTRNESLTRTNTPYLELNSLPWLNFSAGQLYNLSATLVEEEWPYRTEEAWQQATVLKTGPVPQIGVSCNQCTTGLLLPTDSLEMKASCVTMFGCVDLPIHYTWRVELKGIGPINLTMHTKEGNASGVGRDTLTILPGVFVPGAQVVVEIRVHYYPLTETHKDMYKAMAIYYEEYQERSAP